jgi:hypothetical protein
MRKTVSIGARFRKLAVVEQAPSHPKGGTQWRCVCDCGKQIVARATNLVQGFTGSCGCSTGQFVADSNRKHGQSRTPVYKVWRAMHDRCENPNNTSFKYHGARGIKVCKRWGKFENFIADMGPRPDGMTLERKNNNKGYTPANCTWATANAQQNNRRGNRCLRFDGRAQTIKQWADETGQPALRIWQRLSRGWSVERALTTPKIVPRAGKVLRIRP